MPTAPDESLWMSLSQTSFRHAFVDVSGVRTRFIEAGDVDRPHVLMLHGTGAHWETFTRNIGPLSEHFHVVAYDMVGNGFSDRPDVDYEIPVYGDHAFAVMEAFGMERASLLGTSLGSWVAVWCALRRPELIDRMVLMSPSGLYATDENMARIKRTRTAAVTDPSFERIKAIYDHLIADEAVRLPELVRLRQAIYSQEGMAETMKRTLVLQERKIRERNLIKDAEWGRLSQPCLFIASDKDHDEYQSTAYKAAAMTPNGTVAKMPGTAHWPHFEDPDVFNALVIDYLAGASA